MQLGKEWESECILFEQFYIASKFHDEDLDDFSLLMKTIPDPLTTVSEINLPSKKQKL